ncbi:molybdenum cofactor guanylyltransferase [Heyndrickxia oleronia]|uniref:Probable molybdenum cofactor guanylyltransferase n=1 Tax=Heyndrickxia oleronia TaxID=38875 RepID=A0AAW6T2G3_9BACI|nr:molybdenum cofactor guanylyltransferase [Heyndrickxia oleronia]MDH5162874.1 molybdenum cofactor guanylyltransferase [Heyndrickxia oleronia]
MNTIILAGGKSSRMGENKALLTIGEMRVIDRLVDEYSTISHQIILITNQPEVYDDLRVTIKSDVKEFRGQGPLAGIYTGLKEATTATSLIIACDMPFASSAMGGWLEAELVQGDYDAVIPSEDGQLHPLFGAYNRRILPVVRNCLVEKKRRVTDLLSQLHMKIVEKQDAPKDLQEIWNDSFWNMNTKEDYRLALEIDRRIRGDKHEL